MRSVFFGATCVFAAALVASVAVNAQQKAPRAPLSASQLRPAPAGALPPLPQIPFEPVRPMPVVQQVYEFAARHPEVLQYVPCYCGCEQLGHKGNHDCFVRERAANGDVVAWDEHGTECTVCIDVATRARQLHAEGKSVADIRSTIEKDYAGRMTNKTPTPHPHQ